MGRLPRLIPHDNRDAGVILRIDSHTRMAVIGYVRKQWNLPPVIFRHKDYYRAEAQHREELVEVYRNILRRFE